MKLTHKKGYSILNDGGTAVVFNGNGIVIAVLKAGRLHVRPSANSANYGTIGELLSGQVIDSVHDDLDSIAELTIKDLTIE